MERSNRIWILMGKKLSASATPAEQNELDALLVSDPELWYSYELLQAVISMDDVPEAFLLEIRSLLATHPEPEVLNAALNKHPAISEAANQQITFIKPAKRKSLLWVPVLACMLVLIAVAVLMFKRPAVTYKADLTMNEVRAPKGSKTQITLTDGTTIWLNAGSKILYPKTFNVGTREVYLTGEAYFKVRHDAQHPFIVHTPDADVKDLGTVFNVKAYPGNATMETTLIEGSVEVEMKGKDRQKVLIKPNEKLVLKTHILTKGKADNAVNHAQQPVFEVSRIVPYPPTRDIIETAWMKDKLIFRNQRFADLAGEMERKYNISISITDAAIADYHLSGILINEDIEEALKLLQVVAPFSYRINENRVVIFK